MAIVPDWLIKYFETIFDYGVIDCIQKIKSLKHFWLYFPKILLVEGKVACDLTYDKYVNWTFIYARHYYKDHLSEKNRWCGRKGGVWINDVVEMGWINIAGASSSSVQ